MNSYLTIALSLAIGLLLSILTFAWYNDWIVINCSPHHVTQTSIQANQTYKKKIKLVYTKQNMGQGSCQQQEIKELLWSSHVDENAYTLIQAWLAFLEEEEIINKKIILQTATLTSRNEELILSFDQTPLDKEASTTSKLIFIENLLATLNNTFGSTFKKVRLLVNHKPLLDQHLDFSLPWPTTSFIGPNATNTNFSCSEKSNFTIMINPAGDARTTGRTIGDIFERSITMHAAQELKKLLEEHLQDTFQNLRIILTRYPGEMVEPLQNASFANRLKVDIYISIHCYQEKQGNPHCALSYALYDPDIDWLQTKKERLALYPYQQSYRDFVSMSAGIAHALYKQLQEQKSFLIIEPVQAFPCTPLMGVHTTAVCIEMGLSKKDDWHLVIKSLAHAMQKILIQ